ncbi:MAG TPA: hypothetical protein VFM27_20690 [Acidimicrobiales bacterium]|nr:hypothetical protein [Acidimicrobiales bacterium]
MPRVAVIALVAALVAACSGGERDRASTTTTRPAPPTAADLCAQARAVPDPGRVAQPALVEASGLVASRAEPGLLWAHNDSGGAPEVFAIGEDGSDRGRWSVAGASARDWEDMAAGPGPADGDPGVLYLGDIGDNNAQREEVVVYRVAEPRVPAGAAGGDLAGAAALTLTYADGPRDAEALLADPLTADLFVVTKQWGGGPAGVYRIPAGVDPGTTTRMERAADVGGSDGRLITGGDVSPDGSVVGLRTYTEVLLWDRGPDQTVPEALAGRPCTAPSAAEPQGESLALAADGRGYLTVSEGANPPLHAFRLPGRAPPPG